MFSDHLILTSPIRYIVRDSDSRLNARDRIAVEEWIESGKPIHSIRDHVNHCFPMNGGMWGGIRGAIKVNKSGYSKQEACMHAYV